MKFKITTMRTKVLFLSAMLLCAVLKASAALSAGATFEQDGLLYTVLDADAKTVSVALAKHETREYYKMSISKTKYTDDELTSKNLELKGEGLWGNTTTDYRYIYCSTVASTVGCSTQTSVVIPATVNSEDGDTYSVTQIANAGFTWTEPSSENPWTYYPDGCGHYSSWSNYYNPYLKTVTFELPSNITSIGEYAFSGCVSLESFTLPISVETLGNNAFTCCSGMTSFTFQTELVTDADGQTYERANENLTTLPASIFRLCTSITSMDIPQPIAKINDSALQLLTSMTSISLPNSLTYCGPHFICGCIGLTTVTIPASVTNIEASFLHGCSNMRTVYLLSEAAALAYGSSSAATFGDLWLYCYEGVNNCTFYVYPQYYDSYVTDDVWNLVYDKWETGTINTTYTYWDEEKGDSVTITINHEGNGNHIVKFNTDTVTLKGRWETMCLPHGYNVEATLGQGAKGAVFDGYEISLDEEKKVYVYQLNFKCVDYIEAGTPAMVKAPDSTVIAAISAEDITKLSAAEYTNKHAVFFSDDGVELSNGKTVTSTISMNGMYIPYQLQKYDVFYGYPKTWTKATGSDHGSFYRVATDGKYTLPKCRCWWTIKADGVRVEGSAKSLNIDEGVTDIDLPNAENTRVVIGVYDLNGRKLDIPEDELPRGLFIVNGKKILIK